ncbi:hypothetical protein [Streptomyces sp. NBC_01565]|uniref:hypothetical protein n=1 Tax=Streptomyces sp. NBC_01565 TaxID=2975881 RepID=UPI0022559D93|nr:hypothetical protein [Streptomyces sp. NBC_01565]MCX4546880.1 hypothetical protein [Streptomyces sp. NBC_01565]
MQTVVAGQGYVGNPLAVRAAEVGHRVVRDGVDLDRIRRLTTGDSYVEEVVSAQLRAVLSTGAYFATTDAAALAVYDIAVINVPAPLRDGVPDPGLPGRPKDVCSKWRRQSLSSLQRPNGDPGGPL